MAQTRIFTESTILMINLLKDRLLSVGTSAVKRDHDSQTSTTTIEEPIATKVEFSLVRARTCIATSIVRGISRRSAVRR